MKHLKWEKGQLYDGSQIEPNWAFKEFNIKESSIISWIGPMDIKTSKIIDYEDVHLEIKADEMLHFIIEHFDHQPADLRICYHRQRLFVTLMKDALHEVGIKVHRDGDDLYFQDKKLSVSIATCSISSMKIHFGLNVTSRGTPPDVPTVGLLECGGSYRREDIFLMADKIGENYIREMASIESDIAKTRVF
jgi:uncharacterized protein